MKSEHQFGVKVGLAFVAIFLIGGAALCGGYLEGFGLYSPLTINSGGSGGSGTGDSSGNTVSPPGTFNVKSNAYNSLDISSALTLGTNVDQSFYGYRNGQWILLGPHTATTGTDLEVTAQDNGYIYVLCAPHSTQTYVFDQVKTLQMNSRAESVQFVDVTGDGVEEFLVKYNMRNLPASSNDYPSTTFTGFYYYEDTGSTTDGSPDNVAVGTSVATTSVEWYLQISAANRATPWTKIQIKMDTTDTSVAKVTSLSIPGVGTIAEGGLDYWYDSSYQYYEYSIGSNLGDCGFFTRGSADSGKIYLTTQIRTDLASANITCTMTVFQLNYAGSTVTDADEVSLTTV